MHMTNPPAKNKYISLDLHRKAKLYGVPLVVPKNIGDEMAKGSMNALRFITAVKLLSDDKKDTEAISRELWKRLYSVHKDISQMPSILEAARDAKIAESLVEKASNFVKSNEVKDELKKSADELMEAGGFGAPSIIVHGKNGKELFFGSDQMQFVAEALGEKYLGPFPGKS